MHFPKIQGKCKREDILQQLFDNRDFATGLPMTASASTAGLERDAKLRIWRTLRELDTMPVFIPCLRDELYRLLDKKNGRSLQEEVATEARNAMNDVKHLAATARKAITKVVEDRVEERIVETIVEVVSCEKCDSAERKAKKIAADYKCQSGKTAKAVRRVMDKILSVWRGK